MADTVLSEAHAWLTRLLQCDFTIFLQTIAQTRELQDFLETYLAGRQGGSMSASLQLVQMDRLVLSTIYRIACASDQDKLVALVHFQDKLGQVKCTSYADLLATCFLLKLPVIVQVCSLLGEANRTLSAQIAVAIVALQPNLAVLARQIREMFGLMEVYNEEIMAACSVVAHPHQATGPNAVSINKGNQAKVVSLRKPTLAEKARGMALAAANASVANSATAKTATTVPKSSETDLQQLQALALTVCDKSHSLTSILASLPDLLCSPGLDVLQRQDTDSMVGTAGESLLLSLRRMYEQVIPAIAGAKNAWLKAVDGGCCSSAKNLCTEIDRLLARGSRCLVDAICAILLAAQADAGVKSGLPMKRDGRTVSWCNWPVIFEKLLSPPPSDMAAAGGDQWLVGTLLADAFKARDKELMTCIRVICSDAEQADYFIDVLRQHHTTGLYPFAPASVASKAKATSASSAPSPSSSGRAAKAAELGQQQMQEAVGAVLSIFSDVGDGYAAACLQAFDWDVDRTVDALLSENLPPTLRKLDRSLKHVWIGKGGPDGGREVGTIGVTSEKVYVLPENDAFKRAQKERMLAEERRREEDFLLMAADYQDDYDDQWDDASEAIDPAAAAKAVQSSKAAKKGAANQSVAQRIQWEVQMDKMKRVNSLIRENEAEDNYWADMRNTNHERGMLSRDPVDIGGDAAGDSTKLLMPPPRAGVKGHGGKSQGPPPSEGDKGARQKPRTKMFDKHHAKDKTLKGRAFL